MGIGSILGGDWRPHQQCSGDTPGFALRNSGLRGQSEVPEIELESAEFLNSCPITPVFGSISYKAEGPRPTLPEGLAHMVGNYQINPQTGKQAPRKSQNEQHRGKRKALK